MLSLNYTELNCYGNSIIIENYGDFLQIKPITSTYPFEYKKKTYESGTGN